jgi:hypothetical protein
MCGTLPNELALPPGSLLVSTEMYGIIASTELNLEPNVIEILKKLISRPNRMAVEVTADQDAMVQDGHQWSYSVCWGFTCPGLILAY